MAVVVALWVGVHHPQWEGGSAEREQQGMRVSAV